jgi:hypothetical protein
MQPGEPLGDIATAMVFLICVLGAWRLIAWLTTDHMPSE